MSQVILTSIAAFLTLCIFSFLYKENPFYRFAEHLAVGVSAGYWIVILYNQSFTAKVIIPFREGNFLPLFPCLLGILLFTRLFGKIGWISRIPMAYILGVGSGAAIPLMLQTYVLQQIHATMRPVGFAGILLTNLLIAITVLCGIAYFFFSTPHKGVFGGATRVGIWTLMIGFGATFGFTVMGRISLLLGRVNFLIDWVRLLTGTGGTGI
ncbi:MAG: hypothetical protein KJ970_10105 [Candidatus Eisenbacteria bacterium]|uniref:Uncharacterized protein n=1 Tax=Eiseniibacteriota bacterium TaxID=2212470 RepID=A0A948RY73_UNCEI|nr:hypothetical protein [Candidatus Eisenbacteria bacterium]MBU1947818.1 hypothetical protein [Candidatus Eisenbacteria bacterium]MBU2691272.1 hypothetical protein [Candidatus Eisenbacteria bacterium]